jgi:hypothetical protein
MIRDTNHPLFDEIAYAHVEARARVQSDETNRVGWEEIVDSSAMAIRAMMLRMNTKRLRNDTFYAGIVDGQLGVIVRKGAKH